jgi:transposase-like protein
MAQQETMTMLEFNERFSSEEACREYLYEKRWPQGFVCPKCGVVEEPYQIVSRNLYQCKHCNHQVSVTAGTIMDKTKTPLLKWFLAIYLMSTDKRGCSALRLKRELGIAYDTAWTMTHKIRNAMKERDENYQLSGYIEMDEGFFGSPSKGEGKRGRGTDKTPVAVGLSLDEKGRPVFIKAVVLEAVDSESVTGFANGAIEKGSVVSSDGLGVYNKLLENGFVHQPFKYDPVENPDHLKWLHVAISNMKAFLNGTYHGVPQKHLQRYLDEFCYRFNRRFWVDQLFARSLCACANTSPFRRYELIG